MSSTQIVLTDIRELKGRILETLNAVITRHALSLSDIFNLLKDYDRSAVTRALEELVEDGHIVVEYTSGYEVGVRTTDLGRRMKRLKVNQLYGGERL